MRQSVPHLKPVNPEGRERGRREKEGGGEREGGRKEERGREIGIKNGFMHSTNINNHLQNNK